MIHSSSIPFLTYRVGGVQVHALKTCAAADVIVKSAARQERLSVHLCNAYTISLASRDQELMEALRSGDLNLPDGTPVAWLGRRHGASGPVRGPSLVGQVVREGRGTLRHYFYGGHPEVATEMVERLRVESPTVEVVGVEAPPYHDLSESELSWLVSRVRESGANILWVGLGTPRQDYLVARLANHLDLPIIPVGAAFDFWAGRVKEAPSWSHGSGLEWMFRLAREPRRLWRRYVYGNTRFVWLVLKDKFGALR